MNIQTQTIQFKVDSNYLEIVLDMLNTLNNLKLNLINDLSIIDSRKFIQNSENSEKELKFFSNHTANLIEEWKDKDEDKIWI
jgi:hypothetical protein